MHQYPHTIVFLECYFTLHCIVIEYNHENNFDHFSK